MDTESFGSQKQAAPKHRVYRGTWTQSVSGHKNRQCRSTGVYRVGVRVHVIHEGHLFKGTDSCRWHVLVNASRAVWVPSACQSKVSTWQGRHLFFTTQNRTTSRPDAFGSAKPMCPHGRVTIFFFTTRDRTTSRPDAFSLPIESVHVAGSPSFFLRLGTVPRAVQMPLVPPIQCVHVAGYPSPCSASLFPHSCADEETRRIALLVVELCGN